MGMPAYPIMAAVIICGMIFGTRAIRTMRLLLNIHAIKLAISTIAKAKEEKRFLIRY